MCVSFEFYWRFVITVHEVHNEKFKKLRVYACLYMKIFLVQIPISVPGFWHPDDAGRETQVQPVPRGIHLCRPQPVPGHRQSLPLYPVHYWQRKELGQGQRVTQCNEVKVFYFGIWIMFMRDYLMDKLLWWASWDFSFDLFFSILFCFQIKFIAMVIAMR